MSQIMQITSFRDVIELWGAQGVHGARRDLAIEVGATPAVVAKWWQNDVIPARYWSALLGTDLAIRHGVTAVMLTRFASGKLKERAS
jgi:hypothetical protein